MDSHNGYSFGDYLRQKLGDEKWRIRWGGEEAVARVAVKLYRARERRGFSQAALADRAGTKQPNISAIENAEGNPTVRTLGRLAAALGIDVGELLEGQDRYEVYQRTGFENLYLRSQIGSISQSEETEAGAGESWDPDRQKKKKQSQARRHVPRQELPLEMVV